MTLDAMDWVWTRAKSRGNARLVLLAVADAATGLDATARMGTAEVMRRLNVSRSTARAAVDAALASGELVEDEPAKGSRATRYTIPGAVNYTRAHRATGPESGPIAPEPTGPESGPLPATGPNLGPSTGPDSGPPTRTPESPYRAESRPHRGPESGPHHPPIEGLSEGRNERARDAVAVIPEFARPLVDQITAAGVLVAWNLTPAEWFTIDALVQRSGLDMLATAAVQAAARNRRGVSHARYFLRAWQSLPPAPPPGTVPAAAPASPAGANVVPFPPAARPGRAAQAARLYADLLAEEQ